jgi:DNA-directed RNA polymerase subunit RPC12/RpoP
MREKLIELLGNIYLPMMAGPDTIGEYRIPHKFKKEIADHLIANGVTVQERGEWEEIEDDWNMETIYKCSVCEEEFVTIDGTPADNLWNYCPHCGAKMMPQPPKGE